jgi:hypothetical protein
MKKESLNLNLIHRFSAKSLSFFDQDRSIYYYDRKFCIKIRAYTGSSTNLRTLIGLAPKDEQM